MPSSTRLLKENLAIMLLKGGGGEEIKIPVKSFTA